MISIKYQKIITGVFIERPNRFIARVMVDDECHIVHVKNTGRCRELLIPGVTVFLSESDNPARKTKYDLIAVEKETSNGVLLVNIDSQIPNDAVGEWLPECGLFTKNAQIKREVKYRNSRFDFCVEDGKSKSFIEVKGVTLENDGVVSFPDAPTERGIKHINELCKALDDGYEAYIIFVIQMKNVKYFTPNYQTHKEFGECLKTAKKKGVRLLAFDCLVLPDSIKIEDRIKIKLNP